MRSKSETTDVLETQLPPVTTPDATISVVAAGMTLDGDSETEGSLQIDGTVRGNVRAGKSVVISEFGVVNGSIHTLDAVIAGTVLGGVYAESNLELQASSRISGEIQAPRMQVEDGAALQGQIVLGESNVQIAPKAVQVLASQVGGASVSDNGVQFPNR